MGTVISSVLSCLGEMTALMPVNGPMLEFPRRFLDRGVGFAVGWIYWFAYTVLAADQVVQVANSIRFQYDDGRTQLSWATGVSVDPAVWISMALVIVITLNMMKVRVSEMRMRHYLKYHVLIAHCSISVNSNILWGVSR
jgi:amino acid transporter